MNPLENLHDITLPPAIAAFPFAWGWWLLVGLLLALLIGGGLYWRNRRRQRHFAKLALAELAQLDSNADQFGQQVNELLKRCFNAYGLRQQSAALHGEPWLALLNQYHQADWQTLLGDPYRPNPSHGGQALRQAAQKLLTKLPREANHA